jgi:eukaryotic-like serine/threonine-protein kinase
VPESAWNNDTVRSFAMIADRQLLFGLLALQNGLINQPQLLAAFQAWTLDKSRSLADHLEARGDLTGARRALLEGLAAIHLETHGGDPAKSLAAVLAGKSTRESLERIGDEDIGATLGRVGSRHGSTEDDDIDVTASYAVGTATSTERIAPRHQAWQYHRR